jgi:hypothetical protein
MLMNGDATYMIPDKLYEQRSADLLRGLHGLQRAGAGRIRSRTSASPCGPTQQQQNPRAKCSGTYVNRPRPGIVLPRSKAPPHNVSPVVLGDSSRNSALPS